MGKDRDELSGMDDRSVRDGAGALGMEAGPMGEVESPVCESEGESRKGRGLGLMADSGNDRMGGGPGAASDCPDGRGLALPIYN